MADGALVAVFQARDFRVVEGFHRVALEILVLGFNVAFLCFRFHFLNLFRTHVCDQRFAFVGFLDFYPRIFQPALGCVVDGQQGR